MTLIRRAVRPKKFIDRRNRPDTNELCDATVNDMLQDDYHNPENEVSAGSLSRSELIAFGDDPQGFYNKKFLGQEPAVSKERADALRLGKVFHAMVLESKETYHEVPAEVLAKNGARSTKAWYEWLDEHGDWYLLPNEKKMLDEWRKQVHRDPIWKKYCVNSRFVEGIEHEKTILCRHASTNLNIRIRLDIMGPILWDLKTSHTIKVKQFGGHAFDTNLHQQAALYQDGVEALTGERRKFGIVAVLKTPPYTVQCFMFDPEFIALGRRLNYGAMDLFAAFAEMQRARQDAGLKQHDVVWQPPTWGQVVRLHAPGYAMFVEDYLPDPNVYLQEAERLRSPDPATWEPPEEEPQEHPGVWDDAGHDHEFGAGEGGVLPFEGS